MEKETTGLRQIRYPFVIHQNKISGNVWANLSKLAYQHHCNHTWSESMCRKTGSRKHIKAKGFCERVIILIRIWGALTPHHGVQTQHLSGRRKHSEQQFQRGHCQYQLPKERQHTAPDWATLDPHPPAVIPKGLQSCPRCLQHGPPAAWSQNA